MTDYIISYVFDVNDSEFGSTIVVKAKSLGDALVRFNAYYKVEISDTTTPEINGIDKLNELTRI